MRRTTLEWIRSLNIERFPLKVNNGYPLSTMMFFIPGEESEPGSAILSLTLLIGTTGYLHTTITSYAGSSMTGVDFEPVFL
jgi:hypothetical protein